MLSLAAALVLHLSPALSIERAASGIFQSDREATNFSAHVGWSLAIPLAGRAIDGRRGEWIAGGTWLAYSLVNEIALHGPEDARERRLNLVSRLVPCAVLLFIDLWRN
jgi:hypothetical protein